MAHIGSAGSSIRLLVLLLSAVLSAPLAGSLRAEEQDHPSGFRLREPRVFIGGHAGINLPQASSDLFAMVTRELTLQKKDFRAPTAGFDVGVPFGSRFAIVFSFDYARTSKRSESRNFVEDNGDPITQTTRFSLMPLTATFRFYPIKQGERVGSYAWIPARILPYVGAGGGVVRYNFEQYGDFVDTVTLDIFPADLSSKGFAATEHVTTGIDIGITPVIFANVEARYSWAKADLSRDFAGFQPIDLAGLRLIGGIYFRF